VAWCISVYCGDTSDTSNIAYFLNIVQLLPGLVPLSERD